MVTRVCDICNKSYSRVKIKYKCKAKRFWMYAINYYGWEKIDVCTDCLNKIISAKKEATENVDGTL